MVLVKLLWKFRKQWIQTNFDFEAKPWLDKCYLQSAPSIYTELDPKRDSINTCGAKRCAHPKEVVTPENIAKVH